MKKDKRIPKDVDKNDPKDFPVWCTQGSDPTVWGWAPSARCSHLSASSSTAHCSQTSPASKSQQSTTISRTVQIWGLYKPRLWGPMNAHSYCSFPASTAPHQGCGSGAHLQLCTSATAKTSLYVPTCSASCKSKINCTSGMLLKQ